ncbi:uncharacterized protein FIBRA_04827 [Fibroporia radiculosa]|uniref:Uncharacterized protein n=1 Tax=Fibroporia radiculosa TaxID=599839 RepID=J4GPW0_9APHY|nr:uncharacterized protein FIBRA_04827 [Fibroporia radiculosa]CCM02720.1 predicted protein [Fibroporia radiculosa]
MVKPSTTNAADPAPIETCHEDMIHDAQLDYYGKRLATCSSDRTVRVFDVVDGEPPKAVQTLKGHTGPVWQVAWAHPKFGHILASCSYDGKVIIWKEQPAQGPSAGGWAKIKEHTLHKASVNSVSWAPHELGAILACASSDGTISVLTFKNDGQWGADVFEGHAIGCNAVSWAPAVQPGSLIAPQSGTTLPGQPPAAPQSVKRFASAGCDNLVKIWGFRDDTQAWVEEEVLDGHTDWVRDVAWAPNIGLPRSYIATASQDKTVLIWTKDTPTSSWAKTALDPSSALTVPAGGAPASGKFPDVVWRVSWSLTGNILATLSIAAAIVCALLYMNKATRSAVQATKESLKNRGVDISRQGMSVKTKKRMDRDDYLDATQRGFVNAYKHSTYGPGPGASLRSHSAESIHSTHHSEIESRDRHGTVSGVTHAFGMKKTTSAQ